MKIFTSKHFSKNIDSLKTIDSIQQLIFTRRNKVIKIFPFVNDPAYFSNAVLIPYLKIKKKQLHCRNNSEKRTKETVLHSEKHHKDRT